MASLRETLDPTRYLSQSFTLGELLRSDLATRRGIPNEPTLSVVANLEALALAVLQPIRDRWGVVHVTSGYRSAEVNLAVGGQNRSQHLLGQAADIVVPSVGKPELARWVRDTLPVDQVILEFFDAANPAAGWVHLSHVSCGPNRRQGLIIDRTGTRALP